MIDKHSQDYQDLRQAVALLETPSLVARMAALVGSPIDAALKRLPDSAKNKIGDVVHAALTKAADAALRSLDAKSAGASSNLLHKSMAAVSGAVGGAFGLAAVAVELPVTTTIMLRSIADIARSEGFDLADPWVKSACLEVFALGGPSKNDDATESAYYATRTFMASATAALAKEMVTKGGAGSFSLGAGQVAKWLAKIIEVVAARFGVVVTEKVAAQAVPVVGAVSGAALNALFTDFFQDMARGHFIVKRLERTHGAALVQAEYEAISRTIK